MTTNCLRSRWSVQCLMLLCAVSLLAGCAGLNAFQFNLLDSGGPSHGTVAQVVALWADGIDVRADPVQRGAPTPGFATRIYLLGADARETIEANGTLTVQLFDDQQPPANPPVPREIWNIDQSSLLSVFKKDALGWGYDLWLPWSNFDKKISKVSVVVVYRPKKGPEVWSSSAIIQTHNEKGKPREAAMLQPQTQKFAPK